MLIPALIHDCALMPMAENKRKPNHGQHPTGSKAFLRGELPTLRQYFGAAPVLHHLAEQVQQLTALQRIFAAAAPDTLVKFCRVTAFVRDTLVISADNGAIAAKLRQQLPSLLARMRQQDPAIQSIRVEVRTSVPPAAQHREKSIALTPGGIDSLEQLAQRLGESKLGDALRRMITRHRKRP